MRPRLRGRAAVRQQRRLAAAVLVTTLACAGCTSASGAGSASPDGASRSQPSPDAAAQPPARVPAPFRHPLPGMPPTQPGNVYAATQGPVPAKRAHEPAYLYVPNSYGSPITTVIDQRTHKVVRVLHTGTLSQHVTPSYDLSTLYVEASASNQIVALDPHTGRIERRYPVDRPYNLYFTPDGRRAIVMDEQHQQIVFAKPKNFTRTKVISDRSCIGPNHGDFSANGRYLLVSCEFSGTILKISTQKERVTGRLRLGPGSKPQDVRLAPDGRSFYVADMGRDLLLRIPWNRFRVVSETPTRSMPHGIYPSKNGKFLYVSARGAGCVQVFSLRRQMMVDVWKAPPGGTPDMGGLSADGRTLWLSSRYTGHVFGWNTRTGKLVADIYVGGYPHGILVWPQPGRYSLGHTGNIR